MNLKCHREYAILNLSVALNDFLQNNQKKFEKLLGFFSKFEIVK
jgi:hypothetical protein